MDGLYPPATPLEQNPAWQEINKQLNAKVQFNIVPPADYATKTGDAHGRRRLSGPRQSLRWAERRAPNVPAFLQQAAADLTPYLGGDAVKAIRTSRRLPTFAWRNLGSVIGGRLWMVPISRPIVSSLMVKNSTIWDQEIGPDYTPKNADDFKRVLQH